MCAGCRRVLCVVTESVDRQTAMVRPGEVKHRSLATSLGNSFAKKVEMMVPQLGSYFVGKPMIIRFLDWISDLDCGIDLLTLVNYRCP